MAGKTVHAAGGIVVRNGSRPLIAVVQRAKDELWVLPRGKLKSNESALAGARTEGMIHLGTARKDEGFDKPLLTLAIDTARAGSGARSTIKIAVGRGEVWRDTSIFYVRREGVDVTFAMAQSKLRPLLDLR